MAGYGEPADSDGSVRVDREDYGRGKMRVKMRAVINSVKEFAVDVPETDNEQEASEIATEKLWEYSVEDINDGSVKLIDEWDDEWVDIVYMYKVAEGKDEDIV